MLKILRGTVILIKNYKLKTKLNYYIVKNSDQQIRGIKI
jgi:hypothetical protein